ncbi:hypothetical protein B0H13DRAFT_1875555 [Mycena leptocephala]|nr:hypothetical protein B0H13DRAFT_1875555 [Mycena leptocephala]
MSGTISGNFWIVIPGSTLLITLSVVHLFQEGINLDWVTSMKPKQIWTRKNAPGEQELCSNASEVGRTCAYVCTNLKSSVYIASDGRERMKMHLLAFQPSLASLSVQLGTWGGPGTTVQGGNMLLTVDGHRTQDHTDDNYEPLTDKLEFHFTPRTGPGSQRVMGMQLIAMGPPWNGIDLGDITVPKQAEDFARHGAARVDDAATLGSGWGNGEVVGMATARVYVITRRGSQETLNYRGCVRVKSEREDAPSFIWCTPTYSRLQCLVTLFGRKLWGGGAFGHDAWERIPEMSMQVFGHLWQACIEFQTSPTRILRGPLGCGALERVELGRCTSALRLDAASAELASDNIGGALRMIH